MDSARDLPSHTSLKSREKGQGNVEDLSKRDFRRELEEREHEAQREKDDKRRQLDRERGRVTSSLESSKKSRLEGLSGGATPAAPQSTWTPTTRSKTPTKTRTTRMATTTTLQL